MTDAGAPRSRLTARDGTRVVSINDGVRRPPEDGQPRTKPECKPSVGVHVNDTSILAYLTEATRKDAGVLPPPFRVEPLLPGVPAGGRHVRGR
jgi:hypothetical protein